MIETILIFIVTFVVIGVVLYDLYKQQKQNSSKKD